MTKELYYTAAFLIAWSIDLYVAPISGLAAWLPKFGIAILPAITLIPKKFLRIFLLTLTVFMLRLVSLFNIGVAVLAVGGMLFWNREILLNLFRAGSWRMVLAASSGVLVFGILLIGGQTIFLDQKVLTVSTAVGIVLSAGLAVVINATEYLLGIRSLYGNTQE